MIVTNKTCHAYFKGGEMTLICDSCGMCFEGKNEFMNHRCSPMRQREQEERDEKDFEEWWVKEFWNCPSTIGAGPWAKNAWLASRRLLREKEFKDE